MMLLKLHIMDQKQVQVKNWLKIPKQIYLGIISIGENNKFKHTSKEIIKRWLKDNVEIFRTDKQGAITIISDGNRINFHTEVH